MRNGTTFEETPLTLSWKEKDIVPPPSPDETEKVEAEGLSSDEEAYWNQ